MSLPKRLAIRGDLPRGTVRAIVRQSGMIEEEFKALL
jgi:hypothetical protein